MHILAPFAGIDTIFKEHLKRLKLRFDRTELAVSTQFKPLGKAVVIISFSDL